MSLKAFHIVFVTLSTLLAFTFSAWSFGVPEGGVYRVVGAASALFGVALIVYGVWFWRKIRTLGSPGARLHRLVIVPVSLGLLWLAGHSDAAACTVCYGEAEGQMIEAARSGVWLMIGLVAALQASFGLFFIVLWRRARKLKESTES
jgi:hypothetical protein